MKRKWIAVCLACLLLLCGCRAVQPIESADKNVQIEKPVTGTTKKGKKVSFSKVEDYQRRMLTIKTSEELERLFAGTVGYPEQISETCFSKVLEEKFFLIPSFEEGAVEKIVIDAAGGTEFFWRFPNGERLQVHIYHSNVDYGEKEGMHSTIYYAKAQGCQVLITGEALQRMQAAIERLTFEKVEIK